MAAGSRGRGARTAPLGTALPPGPLTSHTSNHSGREVLGFPLGKAGKRPKETKCCRKRGVAEWGYHPIQSPTTAPGPFPPHPFPPPGSRDLPEKGVST